MVLVVVGQKGQHRVRYWTLASNTVWYSAACRHSGGAVDDVDESFRLDARHGRSPSVGMCGRRRARRHAGRGMLRHRPEVAAGAECPMGRMSHCQDIGSDPHCAAIARGLPLPKYHQIYLVLREQLEEGRFAQGVPGGMHLVKDFGVARVTVRRALEPLVADRPDSALARAWHRGGARQRHASRGGPRCRAVHRIARRHRRRGLRTSVKVLRCEVLPASDAVARQLDIAPGTQVRKAVRVRATRLGPLSTHPPCAAGHCQGLRPTELARSRPDAAGRPRAWSSARAAEHLGPARRCEVARLLQVDVGFALLTVSGWCSMPMTGPSSGFKACTADRYQYRIQLSRVGGIDASSGSAKSCPHRFMSSTPQEKP